ncbi:MAG: amino acid adenylation domain-containing protein, partial [Burkholderiales bacterium]
IELPISALFADPTLRGMARALADKQAALDAGPEAPRAPVAQESDAPAELSFSQERMWFMHQLAPDSSAYNVPLALRLRGPLDGHALEQALQHMVARHDILRTRFVNTAQGPAGEVLGQGRIPLTRLEAPAGAEVQAMVDRLSREPFRLDVWPLMRAWLIRTAPEDHVLLLVLHHIIGDQWSFAVLGKDLAAGYRLARAGVARERPAAAPRFADYARWHRRWFEGERRQRETAYWTQRLAGLRPVELPTDLPRPRQPSFRGASLRLPLPAAAIGALGDLATSEDATLAMALLALFKVFLQRHTGQSDLAVGLPIANRHHPASENLVGSLVNTLVVRTSLDGEPDFLTVLRRVRASTLEAYEHQDMPFELLVRTLDPARDLGRQPLFNVMFNVVNTPVRDVRFDGLDWSRMDVDRGAAQADLTLVVDPVFDRSLVLEYATDLFRPETVRQMGQHMLALLDAATRMARTPVSAWPMLGEPELQQLLGWGRGRQVPVPDLTLAALLEHGLASDPGATALICGGKAMSCRELEQASRSLAGHLQAAGFTQGHRIGICLPRGPDLLLALLATVRTGATYVPLDPTYPQERLAHQIADADLSLVIGHRDTLAGQVADRVPVLNLDDPWPVLDAPSPPDDGATAPAYLIYTSGSTGRPKGVAVPQEAVVNFLLSMTREPGLSAGDRVLAVTTLGFDIAVLELLLPLSVGATIVLATDAQATDGHALKSLIDTHQVTLMQATPSRWHLLLEAGWTGRPGLRALVGGETLSPELASALLQRCEAVWNMYGPTETTVWSSCWRVRPDAPVSLGQAIDNTQLLVLDDSGKPLPAGAWGEIWIGGAGVATGYWRQAALTAERFQPLSSVAAVSGQRFYRTGDRGRWRRDGTLEHGGRLDDQVKLRGF